ncbi:MAG: Imm5 family immunity protein [Chloroflexota bacterium]
MALTVEIQQLIDSALVSVQSHPKGELTQALRRQIYDALWDQYADVCKWWAIIAARRVQPIYERGWHKLVRKITTDTLDDLDIPSLIRMVANQMSSTLETLYYLKPDAQQDYAKRMLDICEDVMNGLLVPAYAEDTCSGYYYEVMSWSIHDEPLDAYCAWWSAHAALCSTAGYKPLERQEYERINKRGEPYKESVSTEWDDLRLVRKGVYAADAAAYAAYAFAYNPEIEEYDPQKLREFWQWWLTEAIQQAWDKAGKK